MAKKSKPSQGRPSSGRPGGSSAGQFGARPGLSRGAPLSRRPPRQPGR